jgi:hypothetical protein
MVTAHILGCSLARGTRHFDPGTSPKSRFARHFTEILQENFFHLKFLA